METKAHIRKRILVLRNGMDKRERDKKSGMIMENVMKTCWYRNADILLTYVAYQSEADTESLIKKALQEGKRLYCPKVKGEDMDFYRIRSMEDLTEGYCGIKEPPEEAERLFTDYDAARNQCLMLLPGSVFDKEGNRIGYGRGYYDKYLAKHSGIQTIGVCFACQIQEMLPADWYDKKAGMVATEEGIYESGESGKGNGMDLTKMGKKAVEAKYELQKLSSEKKKEVLFAVAAELTVDTEYILEENAKDIRQGEENGMHPGLIDRLRLNEERVLAMAEGLKQVAELEDPVGEVLETFVRPNGLKISKKRVPFGVIGIIYESRPNVTADAFGLCFRSGNAVILKGGSDALKSNIAVAASIRKALGKQGICEDAIQLIESTDREVTARFMKLNQYVDVLIPRGGAGLIRSVVENSTIPVIETGTGNCHIYVDESADFDKALPIIMNAKTQRIGVCNACESLVVHRGIMESFLPKMAQFLREKHVEIRGDEAVCGIIDDALAADEEDYGREYLDYILSVKTVGCIEEAIAHINKYSTKHSEAIITESKENADKFLNEVDAACVYVNASTRFTDGFEFGFGAEIGISTQKMHARGPMGLKELTSYKYTIEGTGQIRP